MIEPNIQDQEFIQAIFNTVIDPLVIVNDQGVVLAANAATEAVFGWSKYELVGGFGSNADARCVGAPASLVHSAIP